MPIRLFFLLLFAGVQSITAQRLPDHVYMPGIRSVKLYQQNNQMSIPLIRLNSNDQLELHFDDLGALPQNYYYSYQLCNADWTPAELSEFDYINGFIENRLSQYRISSVATTKYVHYQALLPESNSIPIRSGNYLLKVFLDADTSKLAFTKRMLVVENRAVITARVQQPFDPAILSAYQKIQLSVNTLQLNILSPQQAKVIIMQNYNWDNAITDIQPGLIRDNILEYNADQDCLFPAGKEYRWADLRSFRFHTERMDRVDETRQPFEVYIRPDADRSNLRYSAYSDRNGWYQIGSAESMNPWWQTDYANVHFTFVPPNNQAFTDKSVYLMGELTGNQAGDTSLMNYDTETGVYTKTLLLKQGYYSYVYATRDSKTAQGKTDISLTEGNYWETENVYTILFYYRSFSSRYDELVGLSTISSRNITNSF